MTGARTSSSGGQACEALLMRAVDYRDSDRVVTLFTQELGKLSALARGARSSKRRFAGALEPYAVIRVELTPSRGELWNLGAASISRSFPGILQDLARMEVAAAALLLVRETQPPREPDPALFLALVQYLTLVDVAGDATRVGLLAFALRALARLGLAPRLDACGRSGERVPEERPAYFDPALGSVVARKFGGGPFLLSAVVRHRLMLAQGDGWLAIAREEWEPEELSLARAALAAFVAAHVPGDVGARLFPP
ncbi:MAG: DNA repair protein RecO [Myxococcales bacterium]